MKSLALLVSLVPAALSAEDFALRSGDTLLDRASLAEAVTGRTLTFFDDGQSRFSAGGAYSYTYSALNGGGSQFGTFEIGEGGVICIRYRNGFDRCDMYVRSGDRLVVLTEDGGRFPVRAVD